MNGIVITGKDIAGSKYRREPSEILPVFKYLKEPENYMPLVINMMLDMIGCYKFPDLRHEADNMKLRREYLIDGAYEMMFGKGGKEGEPEYDMLRYNYWIFKETAIVASCDVMLQGDKWLHDYCMKVNDAAMFGFQNEENERNKRVAYGHGMQFIPYLQYYAANHLNDTNITQTVRLGACFWKVASGAWPELFAKIFPEHDASIERFMYEGELPEMLSVLKKSDELKRCGQLPTVFATIYDTLEDYFNFLCPDAVVPRPEARERLRFKQRDSSRNDN